MPAPLLPASDRSTVRRKADRGRYDADTIHAILDEALICHVGFAVDGRPWSCPPPSPASTIASTSTGR